MTREYTKVEVAVLQSTGRQWADSIHGDLAQLGFDWSTAQQMIDGYTKHPMTVERFKEGIEVLRIHRQMRNAMDAKAEIPDDRTEDDLIEEYAELIANGELDFIVGRAKLAVDLVQRGYPEILYPSRFSHAVWDAVESEDKEQVAQMLRSCPKTNVPELSYLA